MGVIVQKPNLLFVTHRVPFPPDKGDRIRTYHLLRFLSQHANVHLVALADEAIGKDTDQVLSRYSARYTIVPKDAMRYFRGLGTALMGGSISEGMFRYPTAMKVVANEAEVESLGRRHAWLRQQRDRRRHREADIARREKRSAWPECRRE